MEDNNEIENANHPKTEESVELRNDWYQTDSHVNMNFYVKGAKKEDVKINFDNKMVGVSIILPSSSVYNKEINLNQFIKPEESSYKIYSTKVEVKMKKMEGYYWNSLEDIGKDLHVKVADLKKPSDHNLPSYPSSCLKKFDWDKIEQEVKKDEEQEKPEGDAALNQLFQKIYGDGSDEVKKAMNKSFSESGGTVLSTNWTEVKEKKCDVKAPDGMEHRQWEQ